MASKNFSGTLDLPLGSKAARMKWRFTHQKTTGDVIAASPETTELTETGQYNFDLKFGQILIESKLPSQQNWFSHGSVVIDENTAISTLPELLTATSPVTEDVILQMQAILQDARDAEASSLESSIEAQDLLNETQGLISSFKNIEEIKKKATLSLDFTKNEHKTYEALGLEGKPLADILTTGRATAGAYQSPFGLRVAEPNMPRITYDEVAGSPLGLLCEEQRTNLFLNSETPVNQSINTVAGDYTLSFLGSGEITMSGASNGSLVGSSERVSLTVTSSGGVVNLSISGDVNFVQFEAGLFATSYIKTESSQVTRLSDSNYCAMPENIIKGTIFIDFIHQPGSSGFVLDLSDGSNNNHVRFLVESGNLLKIGARSGGMGEAGVTLIELSDGERVRAAVRFSEGNVRACVNGALYTERNLPISGVMGFLGICCRAVNGAVPYRKGLVSYVSVSPVELSDSELMELTK